MQRSRGMLMAIVAVSVSMTFSNAWALTAADQAFLNKKIIAKWNITGKGQIEAAYARGVDILEDHPSYAAGSFNVLVDQDELDLLRADGYDLKVIESDWYQSYAAKSSQTMGGFLTWDEAIAKLDSFSTAFPSLITSKFSLGTSYEGNEMWAVKISDNPNVDESEPEVLITGIHHAREPIAMEIVLHTMRTLLFNYGTDPYITNLVNNREVYFVPFVNPDGYIYNESIAPTGGGLWRKNRRVNAGGTSFGVDPNRNYADHWGFDNQGSSPNPTSETYRGTAAFSEPENQHIRDFVNSRQFVVAINFHSYSNLFLWAPGWADIYTSDEPLFSAIGDSVTSFNNYAPQPGWQLYNTNGDSDDWMYYAKGILSFTPEVGSSGSDGFWPDPSRIPALVNENIPGNLLLIDLADTPARIYPPVAATWVDPDTSTLPDYTLQWSDPGGLNGAVSYRLRELFGPQEYTDDAESGGNDWNLNGFSLSLTQHASGLQSFWGGSSNNRQARMLATEYRHVEPGDLITLKVNYNVELNFDYAYVEVSTNSGQSFVTLPGNITTNSNPNGTNRGNGITGSSGGVFVTGNFSLAAYVGQDILIRFSYETDGGVLNAGVYFDDISPVVRYDSSVVLTPSTPSTSFAVTGKAAGNYYYALRSTDVHGQQSGETPPHQVVVNYVTCDCSCHADPACDGNTDVLDVVETVNVAFRGVPATIDGSCPHAGRTDLDCSGATDVIDVVKVVSVAFRGDDAATVFCDPCTP